MGSQITLESVLAIVPELSLLILLVAIIFYDRLLKPADGRRTGLMTAWSGVVVLFITVGIWLIYNVPDPNLPWNESLYWGYDPERPGDPGIPGHVLVCADYGEPGICGCQALAAERVFRFACDGDYWLQPDGRICRPDDAVCGFGDSQHQSICSGRLL